MHIKMDLEFVNHFWQYELFSKKMNFLDGLFRTLAGLFLRLRLYYDWVKNQDCGFSITLADFKIRL